MTAESPRHDEADTDPIVRCPYCGCYNDASVSNREDVIEHLTKGRILVVVPVWTCHVCEQSWTGHHAEAICDAAVAASSGVSAPLGVKDLAREILDAVREVVRLEDCEDSQLFTAVVAALSANGVSSARDLAEGLAHQVLDAERRIEALSRGREECRCGHTLHNHLGCKPRICQIEGCDCVDYQALTDALQQLRSYVQHKVGCRYVCECGHAEYGHKKYDTGWYPCIRCSCEGYKERACTCGLDDVLKAIGEE